jgi:FKBP-type peptidyl-prolyl cis-trans isomerase
MQSLFSTHVAIVCILTFLSFSCGTDQEGYRSTDNGLSYKFIDNVSGDAPQIGDLMVMHIAYYTNRDSLLFDSKILADSFSVSLVEPTFRGGVEEGFAMMSPGDSALFKVRADSLFQVTFKGQSPYKPVAGENIYFRVKLEKFYSKSTIDSIRIAQDLKMRREEFLELDRFMKENKMDVPPTNQGSYIQMISNGKGSAIEKGDTVLIDYKGALINGYVFDSTANKPFEYIIGVTPVIAGWMDCIPKLVKGDVARIAFPSDLGFGALDQGDVPPYSSLIFDIRIVDVKKSRRAGS